MTDKSPLDELEEYRRILEELQKKREELRAKLSEKLPELQKEREKLLAEIKKHQDAIAELKAKLNDIEEQIRLITGRPRRAIRGGQVYETLKNFIREQGQVTRKDIAEYLGTFTGYTGMVLRRLIDEGLVERVAPGVYKWIGG